METFILFRVDLCLNLVLKKWVKVLYGLFSLVLRNAWEILLLEIPSLVK